MYCVRVTVTVLTALLASVAPLLPGRHVEAQSVPTRTLTRPEVEFAEPFSALIGARELPDGRVIIGDSRERTLQVLDLPRGTATTIGREGKGPQEYLIPSRLYPLGTDSTMLYDAGNARFLAILGGRAVGGTMILEEPGGTRLVGTPIGVDARGGVYFRRDRYPVGQRGRGVNPVDGVVLRFDRAGPRVDTVAVLAIPQNRSTGARNLGNGMLHFYNDKPLASEDVAAVAWDGRVAVVRAEPYRVEWIARDGRRTTGPTVQYQPLRVTDGEKRAALERQIRPGTITVMGGGAGARAAPIAGAPEGFRKPDVSIDDKTLTWPDRMPPFLAGAATVAPDGTLWVLRTRRHDDPVPTYDLFDASGRLTGRVAIPAGTRLLGFGARSVYLIRTDADDLEWIQRYRL